MKKKLKVLGIMMSLTMGMTMLAGCGKDKDNADASDMISKYSEYGALGEYKGIEYEERNTEITDAMLQSEIDTFLSNLSTTEEKTSGKVKNGDVINIDFDGTMDGEAFQGGTTNGAGYEMTLGSAGMIDGFEEQIEGHNVGETFDILTTFPSDYGDQELANKDAIFEITINNIIETVVPEYTDALVAENTDYATIDEYEAAVRTSLEEAYARDDLNYNKSVMMQAVIDNATFDQYPEQEMQVLIDETVTGIQAEADSYGYDLETYVVAAYGFASEADFVEYVGTMVENYMKEKIVVCSIAKAENITPSQEKKDEYKQTLMNDLGLVNEEDLENYYTKDDISYFALTEEVVTFLLENGTPVEAAAE